MSASTCGTHRHRRREARVAPPAARRARSSDRRRGRRRRRRLRGCRRAARPVGAGRASTALPMAAAHAARGARQSGHARRRARCEHPSAALAACAMASTPSSAAEAVRAPGDVLGRRQRRQPRRAPPPPRAPRRSAATLVDHGGVAHRARIPWRPSQRDDPRARGAPRARGRLRPRAAARAPLRRRESWRIEIEDGARIADHRAQLGREPLHAQDHARRRHRHRRWAGVVALRHPPSLFGAGADG